MTNEQLTEKYIELDERVAKHGTEIKHCQEQIGDLKSLVEGVHKIGNGVETLNRDFQRMDKKIEKIDGRIIEIEAKPSKRWDTVITVCITAIVTAVVTFILAKIGLT